MWLLGGFLVLSAKKQEHLGELQRVIPFQWGPPRLFQSKSLCVAREGFSQQAEMDFSSSCPASPESGNAAGAGGFIFPRFLGFCLWPFPRDAHCQQILPQPCAGCPARKRAAWGP